MSTDDFRRAVSQMTYKELNDTAAAFVVVTNFMTGVANALDPIASLELLSDKTHELMQAGHIACEEMGRRRESAEKLTEGV